jgi:glyoxylase-like metal-dependent hydrolase (beta-lactamase superfamily II)
MESREAIIIDPIRDVDAMECILTKQGLNLRAIALTHYFEDSLMGHMELLSKHSDSRLVTHGTTTDGFRFPLGPHLYLEVMHTPGHTQDSVCYVLRKSTDDDPWLLFSGDTVLAEGYGRFDIDGENPSVNASLWNSSVERLLAIPRNIEILAAHNGYTNASVNARELAFGTTVNYARMFWQSKKKRGEGVDEDDSTFIQQGLVEEFRTLRRRNILGDIPQTVRNPPLVTNPMEVLDIFRSGCVLLDVRLQKDVADQVVPRSLCIPMPILESGPSAQRKLEAWLPLLLSYSALEVAGGMAVICSENQEPHLMRRLARVGYDEYVNHVIRIPPDFVLESFSMIPRISTNKLQLRQLLSQACVVDVRSYAEFSGARAHGAIHVPLENVESWIKARKDLHYASRPLLVY